MKKPLNILISGGGTGGHIYPAISIADEIKRRDPASNILFVGAQDRMEMKRVPLAGYPIKGLWISGLDRSLSVKNLSFPFKLISSLWESFKIINKFNPDVVIGTGGFASGPLLKAAIIKKIPTLIQEQNSYPGITNKHLGKDASVICTAYDNLGRFFPSEKIRKTGNPVRLDILNIKDKREEAQKFFKLKPGKKTILVLGGSLGARRINQLLAAYVEILVEKNVQIIWQTGSLYHEEYKKYDAENVQTFDYLNKMDLAYAAADIIISRAGAGSVSELCLVGKPVLFIPSPNVAEDHQTKNALAVVEKGAAVMLQEKDLTNKFEETISLLIDSEEVRKGFSENIRKLALPNATIAIVDEMEKIVEVKKYKPERF